jgi:hypothetical protein
MLRPGLFWSILVADRLTEDYSCTSPHFARIISLLHFLRGNMTRAVKKYL